MLAAKCWRVLAQDYMTTRPQDHQTMRDYTKIEAWKLADDLTVAIYKITRSSPKEEMHGVSVSSKEDLWALKNVSFEVRQGEAFGIIGLNGSPLEVVALGPFRKKCHA